MFLIEEGSLSPWARPPRYTGGVVMCQLSGGLTPPAVRQNYLLVLILDSFVHGCLTAVACLAPVGLGQANPRVPTDIQSLRHCLPLEFREQLCPSAW
jgi:hypothetical protein